MRQTIPVSQKYIRLKRKVYRERKRANNRSITTIPRRETSEEEEDFRSISTAEPWTDSDDDYRRQGLVSSMMGGPINSSRGGPTIVSLTNRTVRQQREDVYPSESDFVARPSPRPTQETPKDEKLLKLEFELNSLKEQIARLVSTQLTSPVAVGIESNSTKPLDLISGTTIQAGEVSARMTSASLPPPPPPPPPLLSASPRTPLMTSKKPHYRVSLSIIDRREEEGSRLSSNNSHNR
jgi:hypothetical protein